MENSHPVQVPQRTFAFAFTLCTLVWSEAYHGLFRCCSANPWGSVTFIFAPCQISNVYLLSAVTYEVPHYKGETIALSRTQGTLFNVTPQKRIKQTVSEPVASSGLRFTVFPRLFFSAFPGVWS